jgi:hypothetical protein
MNIINLSISDVEIIDIQYRIKHSNYSIILVRFLSV